MDYANKNWSHILNLIIGIAILVASISLFTVILPYVVVGGLLIWGGVKVFKTVKKLINKKQNILNNDIEKPYYTDSSQNDLTQEIIDVDFIEVK